MHLYEVTQSGLCVHQGLKCLLQKQMCLRTRGESGAQPFVTSLTCSADRLKFNAVIIQNDEMMNSVLKCYMETLGSVTALSLRLSGFCMQCF